MARAIEWQAYEYVYREKGKDWYWAVGIIAVSVAITAILFNNLLFATLIVLSAFILSVYASRKPRLLTYRINERGIYLGRRFYPYAEIEAFWVEDRYVERKIIFRLNQQIMPHLSVPYDETEPENLRELLSQFLPEEEMEEPLLPKIMEYLGF